MVSPRMFGGASYRICEARRVSHGVDPQLYMMPGHMFGNIPIKVGNGSAECLCNGASLSGFCSASLCSRSP